VIPGNWIGLLLLLAALAPGYVFTRVAERRFPRPARSQLLETAELLVIGAACTTVAALIFFGINEVVHGVVIDTATWTKVGNDYLGDHPHLLAQSIGLILIVACGIAAAVAWLANYGRPGDIAPGITVRAGVFEPAARRAKRGWVAVHLRNGSVVEGYLLAYPTGESGTHDIALQKPIGLTPPGQPRALVVGVDSVIIAGDEIAMIGLRVEDN
jgi:hypothetical protein